MGSGVISPCARLLLILASILSGCSGLDENQGDIRRNRVEDMLTQVRFPDLVVEIDHVVGSEPSELALDGLRATLEEVTVKRKVTILPLTPLPFNDPRFGVQKVWDGKEIEAVHREFLDSQTYSTVVFGEGEAAVIHVIYLDGSLQRSTGDGLLGSQFYNAAVIMPDTIRRSWGATAVMDPMVVENPAADRVERSLLIHEVGHVLGLVDHGAPMLTPRKHEDGDHSKFPESPMFPFANHRYAFMDPVTREETTPWIYDRYDREDLDAVIKDVATRLG